MRFEYMPKRTSHLTIQVGIQGEDMAVQPVRVVIADDHPIVRTGLQTTLSASPLVEIVGVATSFTDLLTRLQEVAADVVVLDLGGMGTAPLTMIVRLQREYPQLRCVIFSSVVDLAPEMLGLGVYGYVVKEELEEHLVAAICAAQARSRYLSPIVQEYVSHSQNVQLRHRLAPQEVNVLKLLASGLGTVAIAEALNIDARTVQNYITAIRRKTGCHERTQLVSWYHRTYSQSEEH
jgi:DNA-binding NarL/FixJ family response regulator